MHNSSFVRQRSLLVALLLAAFLFNVSDTNQAAQAANNVTYFAPTGHYMTGSFKTYWEQNGGLEQFGYPLTEAFRELSPVDGKVYITQYYERAIFEYHPEFARTNYQVLLRLVGNLETTGRTFAPTTDLSSNSTRYYFPQTRHSLSGVFKRYWDSRGGLAVYGYPISEPFQELNPADNKTYTVQYFERARLEHHPELANTKYEVLLGLLGWQQFRKTATPEIIRQARPAGQDNVMETPLVFSPPMLRADLPVVGTPKPLQITPLKVDSLGYGMNAWLLGQDQPRVLGLITDAGFGWVRQQIRWDEFEHVSGQINWTELDRTIDSISRTNVKVLLSVLRSPAWAGVGGGHGLPRDPNTYANFLSQIATRYKGRVQAYEVWNEQNLGIETANRVEAGPYVELLKASYKAVKAADPSAIVLYGGLTPTGVIDKTIAIDDVIFLEQCYLYNNGEIRNYFDALGVHPGSHGNSPDELWPFDKPGKNWANHPSFFFRRVENLREVMVAHGDAEKQVWLTEFGWTTANQAPGYEYGAYNSEDTQARNLVRAFQRAKQNYPWMGVMLIWQLNFAPLVSAADEKSPWGLIRSDWSPRPSYLALKAMPKDDLSVTTGH